MKIVDVTLIKSYEENNDDKKKMEINGTQNFGANYTALNLIWSNNF